MKKLFNETEEQFIRNNSLNKNVKELVDLFNQKFNKNITYNQMRTYKLHNKIKKQSNELFNEKEKKFILENIKGTCAKDFVVKFNKQFNRDVTKKQILWYMKHHKIKNGMRGHKGIIPHNYKEIGTEITRVRKDNQRKETVVKVSKNKWIPKNRYMYKLFNGKIPQNSVVIFLDGDKNNYDKSNLKLINRNEHCMMAGNKLFFKDKELMETSILIAKIMVKTKEAK